MPSHATASRAAFCRSSLTKPDFYLSRWSNSKIGYPYLPAHDPGGGVPAAGGPARVACRRLLFGICPASIVRQASPAPGVRGSLLPGSSAGLGSSIASLPGPARPLPRQVVRHACPARPSPPLAGVGPARVVRCACLARPSPPLPCQGRRGLARVVRHASPPLAQASARFVVLLCEGQSELPKTALRFQLQGCAPCFWQGPPCQSSPGHLPASLRYGARSPACPAQLLCPKGHPPCCPARVARQASPARYCPARVRAHQNDPRVTGSKALPGSAIFLLCPEEASGQGCPITSPGQGSSRRLLRRACPACPSSFSVKVNRGFPKQHQNHSTFRRPSL